MTYHDNCTAVDSMNFGHPVKCLIHNQKDGQGIYECPACLEVWTIGDDDDLPEGLTEE